MVPAVRPDHPDITNDMWKQIDAIVTAYRGVPGSIIAVLRECQGVVGYLPVELMDYIGRGLNLPSSEIYGVVEELPEVVESLIVGFEDPSGRYIMPLFVVLEAGVKFDDALKGKIKSAIRNALSPRHVPDEIYAVPAVPKTLNGKKLEVPVKKILSGVSLEKAANVDSMMNPESLEYFQQVAASFRTGVESGA